MLIGIETESFHLFFQNKKMNIFDFIDKAWELGVDGVEINMIYDYNLHPDFGVLESNNPSYLAKIKQAIQSRHFYCELDTRLTDEKSLTNALQIAIGIGADLIRTYVHIDEYDPIAMKQAVINIKKFIPSLKKHRIKLAIENHEDETSDEIIALIKQINSPWVGAHCDTGNSMMAWEDPVKATQNLAPYAFSTHFKDHIVTLHDNTPVVCGVPIGEGSIDVDECFRILVESSTVSRINIENCYPYSAYFAREKGTGGVFEFTGAFEIKAPPFDPNIIKPMDYYYPHTISQAALDLLLDAQEKGIQRSVEKVKQLRQKYCPLLTL